MIMHYVITFFILALIAGVLGFTGMAGTLASMAQFLALLFVVLFVASLLYSMLTGRRPPAV